MSKAIKEVLLTSVQTYNKPWPVALEFGLQPLLLVGSLWVWSLERGNPLAWVMILVVVQLILGCLEAWRPAREEWRQLAPEKLRNLAIACDLHWYRCGCCAIR